ncbi:MAG: hypothetical protein ACRCZS_08890 [Chroococcidiopsis sp.]
MSDSLSSGNLGKAFFLAHTTNVHGSDREDAIAIWHQELTDIDRAKWADAANDFCRYLKQGEADS